MSELYKNSPLVESVFEIRFPPELSIECRKDEYYDQIRNEFPEINLPLVDSPEPYAMRNYLFRDSKKEKGIQFSINKCSFHRYAYFGFNQFKVEALKYLRLFAERFKIQTLNRVGLRYVNHIPILREDGVIPLDKFLNFGYKIPKSIPEKYDFLHTVLFDEAPRRKQRGIKNKSLQVSIYRDEVIYHI
ncbi:MAG: TIGR04255 family protein [Candidatus Zixiibacteriota bacterium]